MYDEQKFSNYSLKCEEIIKDLKEYYDDGGSQNLYRRFWKIRDSCHYAYLNNAPFQVLKKLGYKKEEVKHLWPMLGAMLYEEYESDKD